MRISDWSSDVCSSDLAGSSRRRAAGTAHGHRRRAPAGMAAGGGMSAHRGNTPDAATIRIALADDQALVRRGLKALLGGFDRICVRSEEHTSELQSLMRISYAVFFLKKTNRRRKKNYKRQ